MIQIMNVMSSVLLEMVFPLRMKRWCSLILAKSQISHGLIAITTSLSGQTLFLYAHSRHAIKSGTMLFWFHYSLLYSEC